MSQLNGWLRQVLILVKLYDYHNDKLQTFELESLLGLECITMNNCYNLVIIQNIISLHISISKTHFFSKMSHTGFNKTNAQ